MMQTITYKILGSDLDSLAAISTRPFLELFIQLPTLYYSV
jgi:hypothetical protein